MNEAERKELLETLILCKTLINTAIYYLDIGRDEDLATPLESLAEEAQKLVDIHCIVA